MLVLCKKEPFLLVAGALFYLLEDKTGFQGSVLVRGNKDQQFGTERFDQPKAVRKMYSIRYWIQREIQVQTEGFLSCCR